jgi:hypothetical protein
MAPGLPRTTPVETSRGMYFLRYLHLRRNGNGHLSPQILFLYYIIYIFDFTQ